MVIRSLGSVFILLEENCTFNIGRDTVHPCPHRRQLIMKYNPQIHHRRSIRLKGYDYSQAAHISLPFVARIENAGLAKLKMMK